MCTVTYLPTSDCSFILTSNRDESPLRKPASPPEKYNIHQTEVFFPKDQQASGTWIATSLGFSLCLLNGAFEKHEHKPPYKKSRGIVLLDFFQYKNVEKYSSEYNFNGIEPFTLIILEHISNTKIQEIRWDGKKIHSKKIDPNTPHIRSSATLYSKEIIEHRKKWFKEWLQKNPNYKTDDILSFHHFAGEGDIKNDVIMNRGIVQTLSISCIHKSASSFEMIYEDLLQKQISHCAIQ